MPLARPRPRSRRGRGRRPCGRRCCRSPASSARCRAPRSRRSDRLCRSPPVERDATTRNGIDDSAVDPFVVGVLHRSGHSKLPCGRVLRDQGPEQWWIDDTAITVGRVAVVDAGHSGPPMVAAAHAATANPRIRPRYGVNRATKTSLLPNAGAQSTGGAGFTDGSGASLPVAGASSSSWIAKPLSTR